MAFVLLAGQPLVPMTRALVAWSVSTFINQTVRAPYEHFDHLLLFNRRDWADTRRALHAEIETALGPTRSSVGDWATILILRATGDSNDASRAAALTNALTKEHHPFGGWRLVETYCDSDPCDPSSTPPTNLATTIGRFQNLDPGKIHIYLGQTEHDHFFRTALIGLARFQPDVPINFIQRLATDILQRDTEPRRLGMYTLFPFTTLLQPQHVTGFADLSKHRELERADSDTTEKAHHAAQRALCMALPHLSPRDQFAAIAQLGMRFLLNDLLDLLRPAPPEVVNEWMRQIANSSDVDIQVRMLSAILYSRSPVPPESIPLIAQFITSSDDPVRMEAIGLARHEMHKDLLAALVASGWNAAKLDPDKSAFEIAYGSRGLINAAQQGLLGFDDAIQRISFSEYGIAAERFDGEATVQIADRIHAAFLKVLQLNDVTEPPEVDWMTCPESSISPFGFSVRDEQPPTDPQAMLQQLTEPVEKHRERRKYNRARFDRFRQTLTAADAKLALADLGLQGMSALVAARPDLADAWYQILIEAKPTQRRLLHQFTVQLSNAFAAIDPIKASTLTVTECTVLFTE